MARELVRTLFVLALAVSIFAGVAGAHGTMLSSLHIGDMTSMGHGMYDEPNNILLEPGKTGEVVWTFPTSGDVKIEFACNVPGHYESGMLGQFIIH